MKLKLNLFAMLIFGLVYSCRTGADRNELKMANRDVAHELVGKVAAQNNDEIQTPVDRKIIRTGEIRFETRDVSKTEALITQSVKEIQGYISGDNVYNSEDRITHRMVIRVPADKFDELLEKISVNALKIESKTIDANDVTEEYIDVEARIKTKKELENRYRELMAKATTVEDMISIEKEMGTLRSDIESIEGRLRYLKDQVSQSTLTAEFYQRTGSSFSFGSKTGQALETGWKWLLAFIVGVIHFWPFLVIAAIIIFVSFRISRKNRSKKPV